MNDTTETTANLVEARSKVDDAEKAVIAITETEKGIAELKEKYGDVIFEVGTTKGMDEAKKARAEIRVPRYTIENLRRQAKAPILALGKAVDSIARNLTDQILAIEGPVDKQIKDEEERKAEGKRLAEEAEKKRKKDHVDNINAMRSAIDDIVGDQKLDPEAVAQFIRIHENTETSVGDGRYEEFTDQAKEVWKDGLDRLKAHETAMTDRVAEEKRQAERDAELEKLLREKAERDEADRKEEARKAEIKAELERKAAAIPSVEEQLDPGTEDLVASDGLPEAKPDQIPYAEMTGKMPTMSEKAIDKLADDVFPDYPGEYAIVEAVCKHFDVKAVVASHWLRRLVADINEGNKA